VTRHPYLEDHQNIFITNIANVPSACCSQDYIKQGASTNEVRLIKIVIKFVIRDPYLKKDIKIIDICFSNMSLIHCSQACRKPGT
jgi:hypothetical protein